MRRVTVDEESAPLRLAPETREAERAVAYETEERAVGQERRIAPPRSRSPRTARAARWAILIFGSVGIFTALVPLATGLPLTEWLQNADFKAAYSRTNLVFAQGTSALRVGNLALAMEKFEQLPLNGTESQELGGVLYPKLMEKGDLARAVRVRRRTVGGTGLASTAVSSLNLGQALLAQKGPDGAVAFLRTNPDARALPELFAELAGAAASSDLAGLETLAGTLSGAERDAAALALSRAHTTGKKFERARTWATTLKPGSSRDSEVGNLILNWAGVNAPRAAALAEALPPGATNDNTRLMVVHQLLQTDPARARRLIEKMTDPPTKSIALNLLTSTVASQASVDEALRLAQSQKEPARQLSAYLSLAISSRPSAKQYRAVWQHLRELAKTYSPAKKAHDDVIRYWMVQSTDRNDREKWLQRILDPDVRKDLERAIAEGGPWEATVKWDGGSASTSRGRPPSQSVAPGSPR